MTDPVLRVDLSNNIVRLTLNRPNRCNAFSESMLDRLLVELDRLQKDQNVHILFLEGAGHFFCSGLDLLEAVRNDPNSGQQKGNDMAKKVHKVLSLIQTIPQIVISLAQGGAFGGGAALLAVSDSVIVDDTFRLGFPELRHGLTPDLLHPFLKNRITKHAYARLLYTGCPIDALTAKEFTLVDRIVPRHALQETGMEISRDILQGDPAALRAAKRILNQETLPSSDELGTALKKHQQSWNSEEVQKRIHLFLNRHNIG